MRMTITRVLLAALIGLCVRSVEAQTLSGHFAEGSGTAPTLTRTATAGHGLFALIHADEATTCTPAPGWTADVAFQVFGTQTYCSFFKLAATGSDSYTFGLGATAFWSIGVVEASVGFAAARAGNTGQAQNDDPSTPGTSGTLADGDIVIAGMGKETAFAAYAPPAGYTVLTLVPASGPVYGTHGQSLAQIVYKIMSGSGTETPSWDPDSAVFSGHGVHAFDPDGGAPPTTTPPTWKTVTGAGAE